MTKRPTNSLTTLMGAGIAAAVVASASMWVSSVPATVDGTAQSAHPSQVQLACPSGIVDPFETTNVAAGTTWSSLATAPVSPAPASVTGQGGVIPTALTLAGQGGGELAGLSAVGCAAARTSQWIATGATTAGADMVLILSNPGPTASVVSIGSAQRRTASGHGPGTFLGLGAARRVVPRRERAGRACARRRRRGRRMGAGLPHER